MKKLFINVFLIIFLGFSINNTNGQAYNPIAKEGARWIIFLDSNLPDWDSNLYEYFMTGDTLINGLQYKKVFWRDLIFTFNAPPFEPEGPYFLRGFIRDDIANRMVYAIDLNPDMFSSCPVNEEFLLYNFSYEIGDSVDFCLNPSGFNDTIYDITTGFYYGIETKGFHFGYSYFEGIGSEFGLFETMFEPAKMNSRYTIRTYLHYYCPIDTCALVVSIPENEIRNKMSIYPNPADEFFKITFNQTINKGSIKLYDIYGNVVYNTTVTKDFNTKEILISDLIPGIYFVVLVEDGVMTSKTKILIE